MDNEQRDTKAKLAAAGENRVRLAPAEINHAQPAGTILALPAPDIIPEKRCVDNFCILTLRESARIYANRAIFCSLPSIFCAQPFREV
jgi:hypothetical protein